MVLGHAPAVRAQQNGCAMVPDDANPDGRMLRCQNGLTIHAARGTHYRLLYEPGSSQPGAARFDAGALLIELDPAGSAKSFQILTPHAIAAVRGTRWAMEVTPLQTSTLVIAGTVVVARPSEATGVLVGPGHGVDAASDRTPLTVKVWEPARVKALLARFGR
jgi:hypothetical protein